VVWPRDRLTRFEVARLIGARSLQISLGAPVLIETKEIHPTEIAKEEFKKIIIPMTVKRMLPNGTEIVIDVKNGIKKWLEEHGGQI
jgi:DNA-directed RNA polymerase subunit K